MDTMFRAKSEMNTINISGWVGGARHTANGGGSVASMSDNLPAHYSPRHLLKRRRLSFLLNRLTLQINNNNTYPSPQWLMIDTQSHVTRQAPASDAPLDLSVKAPAPPPPPQTKIEFVCSTCGQGFDQQDRLAKHVASRHRGRTPESARAYECEICLRRFARSDMLTRHARLHSGVKPYSCKACGQVFSRSDHLATHQRTHTGEKPYRCPSCPYAACRRDMITRHMRTHLRNPQTV